MAIGAIDKNYLTGLFCDNKNKDSSSLFWRDHLCNTKDRQW